MERVLPDYILPSVDRRAPQTPVFELLQQVPGSYEIGSSSLRHTATGGPVIESMDGNEHMIAEEMVELIRKRKAEVNFG